MGISAQTSHPERSTTDHPSHVSRLGLRLVRMVAILVALTVAVPAAADDRDLLVFAAASLAEAMTEVAESYRSESGREVSLVFAASSALARQIENGAPAALFVSANPGWVDRLDESGLLAAGSRIDLLGNRLALIAPLASTATAEITPALDLSSLLAGGRLAVGDPDHVPAGQYARAALQSLGLWADAEPYLARTGDVRGALALVARGETPLGIVYATDATISGKVRLIGLFPAGSHPAILYPAAVTVEAPEIAHDFLRFLTGGKARAIFGAHGFSAPGGGDLDPAS